MEKIPCIKCNEEMWEYIKPYLKKWGYVGNTTSNWNSFSILVINDIGKLGIYNNYDIPREESYNRELVIDVEEFLERAAALKGFTYKRKIMKINGIEIKPGMSIYIYEKNYSHLYIVFPIEDGLGLVPYKEGGKWIGLSEFLDAYEEDIVAICGLAKIGHPIGFNILWEKPKEVVITMDEIAKKFGVPVEQLKIKK